MRSMRFYASLFHCSLRIACPDIDCEVRPEKNGHSLPSYAPVSVLKVMPKESCCNLSYEARKGLSRFFCTRTIAKPEGCFCRARNGCGGVAERFNQIGSLRITVGKYRFRHPGLPQAVSNVGGGFYGKGNEYAIELEAVTTMSHENPSSIHLVRCRSPKSSS